MLFVVCMPGACASPLLAKQQRGVDGVGGQGCTQQAAYAG
jgi:hypothetical protein